VLSEGDRTDAIKEVRIFHIEVLTAQTKRIQESGSSNVKLFEELSLGFCPSKRYHISRNYES